ncbi:MAG: efflux RND transporter periplasmic adaptor subunit [Methylohalobius sp.]|nr:efflux RND transporter periplasmic adaptor subunit [Methylohalobius sp.]
MRLIGLLLLAIGQVGWGQAAVWRPWIELAVHPEQRATAYVEAVDEAELAAEVSGQVVKVNVSEGDKVQAQQVLVEIEEAPLRLARERALAALEAAKVRLQEGRRQLDQAQKLLVKGLIAREQEAAARDRVAVLEREWQAQKALLSELNWQWEKRYVLAPFTGWVVEKRVSPGDFVTPGKVVLVVMAEKRELIAFVPAELIAQLTEAKLAFAPSGGGRYAVEAIAYVPRRDRRAQDVKVRLRFVDQAPPPGVAGTLSWQDPRPHLPSFVLTTFREQTGIWIRSSDQDPCFLVLPEARLGRTLPLKLPLSVQVAAENPAELATQGFRECQGLPP